MHKIKIEIISTYMQGDSVYYRIHTKCMMALTKYEHVYQII